MLPHSLLLWTPLLWQGLLLNGCCRSHQRTAEVQPAVGAAVVQWQPRWPPGHHGRSGRATGQLQGKGLVGRGNSSLQQRQPSSDISTCLQEVCTLRQKSRLCVRFCSKHHLCFEQMLFQAPYQQQHHHHLDCTASVPLLEHRRA